VVLSLVDKEGNPSAARLYVRVTQDSMSAVADDAMEQAQSAKFPQPLDSHVFDALSDQQSLVTSFGAVLKLIKPLVKIGDEIAKVCSLVFLYWTIRINDFSKDPSLCQFSVDGALRRNEGELYPIIIDLLLHIIHLIRWCKPNKLKTQRFWSSLKRWREPTRS
jgi:hypothetical protein